MIEIQTQNDLRKARDIAFCCICGKPFTDGEQRTRQHVPPTSIFDEPNRSPPLILPAHDACNQGQSPDDEVLGKLFSVLHTGITAEDRMRLAVELFSVNGSVAPMAAVKDIPLNRNIFRWVRCFHAALYGEYLPDRGGFIGAPLPSGREANGQFVPDLDDESRFLMTHEFRQQVQNGLTDSLVCRNGQCHYRCTWLHFDNGAPFCLFALRLYNWEELGDVHHFRRRGCIGWYGAPIPPAATRGKKTEVAVTELTELDPFAPWSERNTTPDLHRRSI